MKRLFILISSIFILLTAQAAFAQETANIPACNVTLNGQQVDSRCRKYPLLQFRDIVYFPMTYFDCRYLGITTVWDDSEKKLTVSKENISASLHDYKNSYTNKSEYLLDGHNVQICEFDIEVNGKEVINENEGYPLLLFRNVTYFPLTWRFAVEEFGWEYSYTGEAGFVINSANYHTENLNLPNLAPPNDTKEISVVQNGEYYYYTGSGVDESNFYIYRAPVENPTACEALYTFPEKGHMGKEWLWFYFTVENDTVYMTYRKDPSHMGSYHHYKINQDGSVEETYSDGSFYTETSSGGRGILKNIYDVGDETVSWINRVNYGENSGTAVSYTKDGIEIEATRRNVRFGLKKDGEKITSAYPQILDEKIYVTGCELSTEKNSSLYEINMNDGVVTKIIDDVFDYYVGRNAIFYTCSNTLYRYDITDKSVAVIEENAENISLLSPENGLMLAAKKDNKVTVTAYGESGNKKVIFETEFPTEVSNGAILNGIPREYLYAVVDGLQVNSDSNVRLAVFNNADTPFFSADAAESVFLHGDTLIYVTADTKKAVKVDLGQ